MTFNNTQKLLAGTLALVLVAGMTSPAYAGDPPINECNITLNLMANIQIAQGGEEFIPKEITCDGSIESVFISSTTCVLNEIDRDNEVFNQNIVNFEEFVFNLGNTSEEHCIVVFEVFGFDGGSVFVTQQLWINVPDRPIGGTVGSLDTATLLVAGAQANMGWWSLALVGIVGAGAAITYKLKSKKTEQ